MTSLLVLYMYLSIILTEFIYFISTLKLKC